jgi:hypothetical protein
MEISAELRDYFYYILYTILAGILITTLGIIGAGIVKKRRIEGKKLCWEALVV